MRSELMCAVIVSLKNHVSNETSNNQILMAILKLSDRVGQFAKEYVLLNTYTAYETSWPSG